MARKPNVSGLPERSGSVAGMEDNLKKAVAEMLVLFLLDEREMYIGEIPEELKRRSGGMIHVVFPYSIIYRMPGFGYIEEPRKRLAPDGRRRQYYAITKRGQNYLADLRALFDKFSAGMETILTSERETYGQQEYSGADVPEADGQEADLRQETETPADGQTEADDWGFSGRLSGCHV